MATELSRIARSIGDRITAAATSRDPVQISEADAMEEARHLAFALIGLGFVLKDKNEEEAQDNGLEDSELILACGMLANFHWARFQFLHDSTQSLQGELDLSVSIFLSLKDYCANFTTPDGYTAPFPLPAELRSAISKNSIFEPSQMIMDPDLRASRSAILIESYEATRSDKALAESIALIESTLDFENELSISIKSKLLGLLGTALFLRCEKFGDTSFDIDKSISCLRESLALDKGTGSGERLATLGAALMRRFERRHENTDLEAAISAEQEALKEIPPDSKSWPHVLSNIVAMFALRLQGMSLEGNAARDVYDALAKLGALAIESGRKQDAKMAHTMATLAITQWAAYSASDSESDSALARVEISKAIEMTRSALRLLDPSDAFYSALWQNLSVMLTTLYADGGRLVSDLDEAIESANRALECLPHDHPSRATVHCGAGPAFRAKYELSMMVDDYIGAMSNWRAALDLRTAPTFLRLTAAARMAQFAHDAGSLNESLGYYIRAVSLMPEAAWQGLGRRSQEGELSAWSNLPVDGAAVAIRLGRIDMAVVILEQGRSVLWNASSLLKQDAPDLAESHPEKYLQLQNVATALGESSRALASSSLASIGTVRGNRTVPPGVGPS